MFISPHENYYTHLATINFLKIENKACAYIIVVHAHVHLHSSIIFVLILTSLVVVTGKGNHTLTNHRVPCRYSACVISVYLNE